MDGSSPLLSSEEEMPQQDITQIVLFGDSRKVRQLIEGVLGAGRDLDI